MMVAEPAAAMGTAALDGGIMDVKAETTMRETLLEMARSIAAESMYEEAVEQALDKWTVSKWVKAEVIKLASTGSLKYLGVMFDDEQDGSSGFDRILALIHQSAIVVQAKRASAFLKVEVALGVLMSQGCLLYTSPSPRDRTRSRMPSSA